METEKLDAKFFRRELRLLSRSVEGLPLSRLASRLRRLADVADGKLCPRCKRHPLFDDRPVCATCVADRNFQALGELLGSL